MFRLARVLPVAMALATGGCYLALVPPPPPRPLRSPQPLDWRALVGCYRMGERIFAFDSVPTASHHHERVTGARQAAWLPRRRRPGETLWWITPRNAVEFIEDDGLHGGVYEFVVRGDSLVGRVHTLTDVSDIYPPVGRASAVRVPCPADAAASAPAAAR